MRRTGRSRCCSRPPLNLSPRRHRRPARSRTQRPNRLRLSHPPCCPSIQPSWQSRWQSRQLRPCPFPFRSRPSHRLLRRFGHPGPDQPHYGRLLRCNLLLRCRRLRARRRSVFPHLQSQRLRLSPLRLFLQAPPNPAGDPRWAVGWPAISTIQSEQDSAATRAPSAFVSPWMRPGGCWRWRSPAVRARRCWTMRRTTCWLASACRRFHPA